METHSIFVIACFYSWKTLALISGCCGIINPMIAKCQIFAWGLRSKRLKRSEPFQFLASNLNINCNHPTVPGVSTRISKEETCFSSSDLRLNTGIDPTSHWTREQCTILQTISRMSSANILTIVISV